MTTDDPGNGKAPRILLRQISLARDGGKNLWRIGWRVENRAQHSLRIEAARFPHGQFKAGMQGFDPAISLGQGECAEFEATVACNAKRGEVVENAFVIFSTVSQDSPWRIFVRLRVVVDTEGKPTAVTELITTQQVGFSEKVQSNSQNGTEDGG